MTVNRGYPGPAGPGGPSSVLGRLLEELSWTGTRVRQFRDGGRGHENVLTAEALTALDFLPRTDFLGSVLRGADGARAARQRLVEEIEDAEITLLPDELFLRPAAADRLSGVPVQPDGLLVSPGCFALLEAKRIRGGSFGREQLARELHCVLRESRGRVPLLLLLLGEPPPVTVRGHGRVPIGTAVALAADAVLARVGGTGPDPSTLVDAVADVVAWTTRDRVAEVVSDRRDRFPTRDPSVRASVERLADSVVRAVARHA